MHFSKAAGYAVRSIVFLAKNSSKENKIDIKILASTFGFPEPFLAKVMQLMVRKGFVYSAKGPRGGYYTTPEILDVTLMQLIVVIDGADFFVSCGMGMPDCDHTHPCSIHHVYHPMRDHYGRLLNETTVAHLIKDPKLMNSM
jgi:Rrf2 family protein